MPMSKMKYSLKVFSEEKCMMCQTVKKKKKLFRAGLCSNGILIGYFLYLSFFLLLEINDKMPFLSHSIYAKKLQGKFNVCF